MTDRDPTLDMALRLLGSADPATPTEDDAKFAKRVAASLGQRKAKPAELDDALAAPLPDDHRDAVVVAHEAVEEADIVEEHGNAADAAGDHGDDRSWEGAISRPPQSGTVSALDGLARLTRSGPHPSAHAPPADDAGMAKGPDSGLIDLRGLSQSGEKEAAKDDVIEASELAGTAPATAPEAAKPAPMPSAPPATSTSAAVSPTSAAAKSAPTSAAAASAHAKKKSNAGIWIGVSTFAAAAAFAVFFLNMNKRSAPTSSETRSADVAAAKASTPATAAPTTGGTTEQVPTVLASASAAPPEESASVANGDDNPPTTNTPGPDGQKVAVGTKAKAPPQMANPPPTVATADTTKPTPTATATTTATTGTGKSNGGSLDDVLGLNKPAVPTATVAVSPDLPDKLEAADMRSACLPKQSAMNACVAGLDGPSSVMVQFGPGGTVASVSVTKGPAKGTGAEACIKSALGGVKVERTKMGGTTFLVASP